MDLALILFPLAMALAAFAAPSNARRPWLLPFAGFIHLGSRGVGAPPERPRPDIAAKTTVLE